MKKIKPKTTASGPIAKKVIAGLQKATGQKVVDISVFREAKIHAQDLGITLISEKKMTDLDPLHRIYVYAQNIMSVMVEKISALQPLFKLADICEGAQDEYLPDGPPMSPWRVTDLDLRIRKNGWPFFNGLNRIRKSRISCDPIRYS